MGCSQSAKHFQKVNVQLVVVFKYYKMSLQIKQNQTKNKTKQKTKNKTEQDNMVWYSLVDYYLYCIHFASIAFVLHQLHLLCINLFFIVQCWFCLLKSLFNSDKTVFLLKNFFFWNSNQFRWIFTSYNLITKYINYSYY